MPTDHTGPISFPEDHVGRAAANTRRHLRDSHVHARPPQYVILSHRHRTGMADLLADPLLTAPGGGSAPTWPEAA